VATFEIILQTDSFDTLGNMNSIDKSRDLLAHREDKDLRSQHQ
jgi:hypothetical protein